MTIIGKKKQIIAWVESLEDPEILEQINMFREQLKFDFSKELRRSITADELKLQTDKFIKSLDWKK